VKLTKYKAGMRFDIPAIREDFEFVPPGSASPSRHIWFVAGKAAWDETRMPGGPAVARARAAMDRLQKLLLTLLRSRSHDENKGLELEWEARKCFYEKVIKVKDAVAALLTSYSGDMNSAFRPCAQSRSAATLGLQSCLRFWQPSRGR
jgi:hypothetical protein